jgi:hypothetical protein
VDSAALYRLVAPVREILMREWDPLGVADFRGAADEYDSYIPGVIGLLQEGASTDDLAAHLDRIAFDQMGQTSSGTRSAAAAAALLSLWNGAVRSSRE